MKTSWKKGDWAILPSRAAYTLDNKLIDPNHLGKYGTVAFNPWSDETIDIFPWKTIISPVPTYKISEIRKPNFLEKLVFVKLIVFSHLKGFIHYQKLSWKGIIGK